MASLGCYGHPMANLQIKGLPDDIHEELKRRARLEGMTARAYVQRLIEADQALPSKTEWLNRVRALPPVDIGGAVAGLIKQDREERTPKPPRRRAR